METSILRYTDTVDKCYGLTGMAIAAMALDAADAIVLLSVTEDAPESIVFDSEYEIPVNPSFSARSVWEQSVEHFRLSTGLLLANVVCRHYINRHDRLSQDEWTCIHGLVSDSGKDICSLDDDEIDSVYEKTRTYVERLFSHSGVGQVARSFAKLLQNEGTLSGSDIMEALSPLRML